MANEYVDLYRQRFPDDTRSDIEIAGLFDKYKPAPVSDDTPEYTSAGEEFVKGLSSGLSSLKSTAYGAGALAADWVPGETAKSVAKSLNEESQYAEAESSKYRPVVGKWEDVKNGTDFLNYMAYGAGTVAPSIGEAVATSLIGGAVGAVAGSEVPGAGNVVGAGAGAAGGFLFRQGVKSLVKKELAHLVKEGMARELAETVAEQTVKGLIKADSRIVAREMAHIGSEAVTALNSYALSAGELHNDLLQNANVDPDQARNWATGMGVLAAIPDTFLPNYLKSRFFPGEHDVSKEAQKQAGNFLLRALVNTSKETTHAAVLEGSTEAFQEWVNVMADHFADPTKNNSFELSKDEWSRISNAGAIGAIGGAGVGPAVGVFQAATYKASPELKPGETAPTVPGAPDVKLKDFQDEVAKILSAKKAAEELASKEATPAPATPTRKAPSFAVTPVTATAEELAARAAAAEEKKKQAESTAASMAKFDEQKAADKKSAEEASAANSKSTVTVTTPKIDPVDDTVQPGKVVVNTPEGDKPLEQARAEGVQVARVPNAVGDGVKTPEQIAAAVEAVPAEQAATLPATPRAHVPNVEDNSLGYKTEEQKKAEITAQISTELNKPFQGSVTEQIDQPLFRAKEWVPLAPGTPLQQIGMLAMSHGTSSDKRVTGDTKRVLAVKDNATGAISLFPVYLASADDKAMRINIGGKLGKEITRSAVAAEAGVSDVTAKKVLEGQPGVKPETAKKVLDAVTALGYNPVKNPTLREWLLKNEKSVTPIGFLSANDTIRELKAKYTSEEKFQAALKTSRELHEAAVAASEGNKLLGAVSTRLTQLLGASEAAKTMAALQDVALAVGGRPETSTTALRVDPETVALGLLSKEAAKDPTAIQSEQGMFRGKEKVLGLFQPLEWNRLKNLSATDRLSEISKAVRKSEKLDALSILQKGQALREGSVKLESYSETGSEQGNATAEEAAAIATGPQAPTEESNPQRDETVYFEASKPEEITKDTPAAAVIASADDFSKLAIERALDKATSEKRGYPRFAELLSAIWSSPEMAKRSNIKTEVLSPEKTKAMYDLLMAQQAAALAARDKRKTATERLRERGEKRQPSYTRAKPSIVRATATHVAQSFDRVLSVASHLGIDVRLVQAAMYNPSQFVEYEQGLYKIEGESGKPMIVLAMHDLERPTNDNLRALLHELAHHVVKDMDTWSQKLTHEALERLILNDGLLRSSNDPRLTSWEVAQGFGLTREQYLTERLVEHLTAMGMQSERSRGIASSVLGFFRRLFSSVGRFFSQMVGHNAITDDAMLDFVNDRYQAILDGGTFLGSSTLGKLGLFNSPEGRTRMFQLQEGEGALEYVYDPVTGERSAAEFTVLSPASVAEQVNAIMDARNVEGIQRNEEWYTKQEPGELGKMARRVINVFNHEVVKEFETLQEAREFVKRAGKKEWESELDWRFGTDIVPGELSVGEEMRLLQRMAGLRALAEKVVGPEVKVAFTKTLTESKESARRGYGEGTAKSASQLTDIRVSGLTDGELIALAASTIGMFNPAGDAKANWEEIGTTLHEAFHALQNLKLSPAERDILKARRKDLIEYVSNHPRLKDLYNWEKMPQDELEAYAFDGYCYDRFVLGAEPEISKEVKSVFARLAQIFRTMYNELTKLGYTKIEDLTPQKVFEKAIAGEMARREIFGGKAMKLGAKFAKPAPEVSPKQVYDLETLASTINSVEKAVTDAFGPILAKDETLTYFLGTELGVNFHEMSLARLKEAMDERVKQYGLQGKFRDNMSLFGANPIQDPIMRQHVEVRVYKAIASLKTKIAEKEASETNALAKETKENLEAKNRFLKVLGDVNDGATLQTIAREGLTPITGKLRADLTSETSKGPAAKVLYDLLGITDYDIKITDAFSGAVDVAERDLTSGSVLLDSITEMAKTGFDTNASVKDSLEILRKSESPILRELTNGDPVNRVKLSLLLSLANKNPYLFGLARLRVEKNIPGKLALIKLLDKALAGSDTEWKKQMAQARLNSGAKLPEYSEHALKKHMLTRAALIRKSESIQKREKRLPNFVKADVVLQGVLSNLEERIGITVTNGPIVEGGVIFHVTDPKATRSEAIAAKDKISVSGEGAEDRMAKVIMDNEAWLKTYSGPKDAFYRQVRDQNQKMTRMLGDRMQKAGRRIYGGQLAQGLQDRLYDTGYSEARDVGKMFTTFVDRIAGKRPEVTATGEKVITAYAKAADAFGLSGNFREFNSLLMTPAYEFILRRPDLKTDAEVSGALYAYLKTSSAVTSRLLDKGGPTGWKHFVKFLEVNSDAFEEARKIGDEWGVGVADNKLKVFNPLTGKVETGMRPGHKLAYKMAPRTVEKVAEIAGMLTANWVRDGDFGMRHIEDRYVGKNPLLNPATLKGKSEVDKMKLVKDLTAYWSTLPQGREGVIAGLKPYFTPDVIGSFVRPYIGMSDTPFSNPQGHQADPANVRAAWEASGEDVVVFAEKLFELEKPAEEGKPVSQEEVGAYVADIVRTFKGFQKKLSNMSQSSEKVQSDYGVPGLKHELMDARVANSLPPEFISYAIASPEALYVTVNQLAAHSSFGRERADLEAKLGRVQGQILADNQRLMLTRKQAEASLQAEGKVPDQKSIEAKTKELAGEDYGRLKNAEKQLQPIDQIRRDIKTFFDLQANPDRDTKVPLALVRAIATMMVNTVRTVLWNGSAIFEPFMRYRFSGTAFKQLKYTGQALFNEVTGSLASAFGKQLVESADERAWREKAGVFYDPGVWATNAGRWANPGRLGAYERDTVGQYTARIRKTVDTITDFGVGGNDRYAKIRPFGPLVTGTYWVNRALMRGSLRTVENLMAKTNEYFVAHPEAVSDPTFKFTPEMLGFGDKFWMDNAEGFRQLRNMLEKSGLPMEWLARRVYERKSLNKGWSGFMLAPEEAQSIMARALDELSLEANVSNSPAFVFNNQFAKAAMPLLTWPMNKSVNVLNSLSTREGEFSKQAALYGIKSLALAVLPLGLAYTMLMDEWDDKVLGKKSSLREFSSEASIQSNMGAALERIARLGTFGLAGDMVNGIVVGANDGDLRAFSLDQRILFMNTLQSGMRAMNTLIHQGPTNLTYDSFYRPLVQTLGGAQPLQYMQTINNFGNTLAGVEPFDREARATYRITVNNYLRAAARGAGLDVRTSAGASSLPTPVKPWVQQMVNGALVNDSALFAEAYKNAVEEAKEMGQDDPEGYVKRAFGYYHPLKNVTKTPPTEQEVVKLMRTMNGNGQEIVREAVKYFNVYGAALGIKPFEYAPEAKKTAKPTKPFTLDDLNAARRNLLTTDGLF